MLLCIEQVVSRCRELFLRVLGVTPIASGLRKLDPDRRRHEQGIAPAPTLPTRDTTWIGVLGMLQTHGRRILENRVEPLSKRHERFRTRAIARRPQIRLGDDVIVRMIDALTELPFVCEPARE